MGRAERKPGAKGPEGKRRSTGTAAPPPSVISSSEAPRWISFSTRSTLAGLLLVAAATIVAFLPAAQSEFVDWYDFHNLTRNEHIRELSVSNLKWMFSGSSIGGWQPLSWFVAALEYRVFHGPDEASFSRGVPPTDPWRR